MLIRTVLAIKDTSFTLPPYKRSLQTIDPSLSTNVGDLPLRTPIHRRFGGPLPRQLPNGTHAHPTADRSFNKYTHADPLFYAVLIRLSPGYPPL